LSNYFNVLLACLDLAVAKLGRLSQQAKRTAHKRILAKFRLPLPEPIAVFEAGRRFLREQPAFSFFSLLILITILLNVSVSERFLVAGIGPASIGGPETEAELAAGEPSENLIGTANDATPEAFSGYFFVFDDSVAGWSNPVSDSLGWIPKRSEIILYEVADGDSPASIASKFDISTETVLWANNLSRGSLIQPGQKLVILPVSGILHEVKAGETLSAIAKRYGVGEARLLAVNTLAGNELAVGDKVIIPGAQPPEARQNQELATNRLAGEVVGFFKAPTTGWNWGRLHRLNAVDIANACGTPVFAAASGFVTDARNSGWNSGYGNFVKIKHEGSTETIYSHLSGVLVSAGAYVNQGDIIGSIGNTGKTHGPTGCHLHFEVRGATNPFARY